MRWTVTNGNKPTVHKFQAVAALCLAFAMTPQAAFAEPSADEALPQTRTNADIAGRQELIGTIEGIPRHRVVVPNLPEGEADIVVDGRVDEPAWQHVPAYDNMLVYIPGTGEPGHYRTETRLLATDRGLFVSAGAQAWGIRTVDSPLA